ncbi:MAG: DoxX family protein [Candidatus Paceibacterota bacterium]
MEYHSGYQQNVPNMQFIQPYEQYFLLIGRVLIGGFFLISGLLKFTDIEGIAAYIGSVGLPMPVVLAWLAAIAITILGGMLIAGYKAYEASLGLALYVLLATALFHGPQHWPLEMAAFLKNAALLGGILAMTAHLRLVEKPGPSPLMGSSSPTPSM